MFEKPTLTGKIWRYLELHQVRERWRITECFASAFESALEDKHEGTLPWPNLEKSDPDSVRTYDDIQAVTAVNCWQVSEEESAAMWRVYAGQGEGLAIQSTYEAVRDAGRELP